MTGLEPLAALAERPGPRLELPDELRRLYGGDLALPERCLFANFVATLDGAVAIPSLPQSNRLIAGDSAADRFVMGLLRAAADAVLVGSGTVRASPRGRWQPHTVYPPAADAFRDLRRRLGRERGPRVAIVTGRGTIPPEHPVLSARPLVLTTAPGAARLGDGLPPGAEIVVLPGETVVDVRAVVELLDARGYRRILSEAGPHLFGSLVAAGLVDELFLTLSPLLAGRPPGDHLGLLEGVALLPEQASGARLRSVRLHADHLFLHYALARRAAGSGPREDLAHDSLGAR